MVKFKNFSRPLSVFQVLFKANLILKDFSRQSCIFKYFSSQCEPCKCIDACTCSSFQICSLKKVILSKQRILVLQRTESVEYTFFLSQTNLFRPIGPHQ